MIKSMTGYGRGEATLNGRVITVELRSVNNRYLDCSVRLPRVCSFAEEHIKSKVKEIITRGKVDVYVSVDTTNADSVSVKVNRPLAESYLDAFQELSDFFHISNDISASVLTRFQDILIVEKLPQDQAELQADIDVVLETALAGMDDMRTAEGDKLEEDLHNKLNRLEEYVCQVEQRSPQTVQEYRDRLYAKLQEILNQVQVDESRILTEAAIFADKVAVDEETVRLRSHIEQFRTMLECGGVVGRKLDFLIQEMNRETNTIGSKCTDLTITRIVVEMKSEIEKLREQVQNIE